jgi:hypothetical protein
MSVRIIPVVGFATCVVIPGRRAAASPESITNDRGVWIPGSPPLRGAPE